MATPENTAEALWVDLFFDERFLGAVHRAEKDVESRFNTGVYRRIRAGTLVRCQANPSCKESGRDTARHYQSWWFVAEVVKKRSFYDLYRKFRSRLLPGRPQHYEDRPIAIEQPAPLRMTRAGRARVIDAFVSWRRSASNGEARRKNNARLWSRAEVEKVFHSIYVAQHPTLAAWRESQQAPMGVVGLVLWRLPAGFVPPLVDAMNARKSLGVATIAKAVASQHHLGIHMVQRAVRGWLARAHLRVRRMAFKLYGHMAKDGAQGLR